VRASHTHTRATLWARAPGPGVVYDAAPAHARAGGRERSSARPRALGSRDRARAGKPAGLVARD